MHACACVRVCACVRARSSQHSVLYSYYTYSLLYLLWEQPALGMAVELLRGASAVGGPPNFDTCTRDTFTEGTHARCSAAGPNPNPNPDPNPNPVILTPTLTPQSQPQPQP